MNEYEPNPTLRVGDADRERVAEQLRKAHAEGRIDVHELQQRIDRCYRARTAGELRSLVADLPGPVLRRPAAAARPWTLRNPVLVAVAVLVALSVTSGIAHAAHFFFWPPLLLFVFFARGGLWRCRRRAGGWQYPTRV